MEENLSYIFRGENESMYSKNEGKLIPKGSYFVLPTKFGMRQFGTFKFGKSDRESERISLINHQEGSNTSGVSFTPNFERAKFYALGNGKYDSGYIFVVDSNLLHKNKVTPFRIKDKAISYDIEVKIPEDEEIILVSFDDKELSSNIIVEILKVNSYE